MKPKPIPEDWRIEADGWLESLKAAGYTNQTLRSRRYKLCKLARDLHTSPYVVTEADIIHVFAVNNWKPETLKGYRNTIVSFYKYLQHAKLRLDNPAEELPAIRKQRPKPRPCPDRYIYAALQHANEQEVIMIRLAAECGLRRHEIAKVHSNDVICDLLGKSLIVVGKAGVQRIVPIPEDLADIIEQANGYVFPGRWSGHVEESYIGSHISRLLPKGWSAHTLRHRYATTTYAATHDIYVVSKLLGHASVETTQNYTALPESRLRAGLSAVILSS